MFRFLKSFQRVTGVEVFFLGMKRIARERGRPPRITVEQSTEVLYDRKITYKKNQIQVERAL